MAFGVAGPVAFVKARTVSGLCVVFNRQTQNVWGSEHTAEATRAADLGLAEQAKAILRAQRYRGPDAENVWIGRGIAIGHGLLRTMSEDDFGPQPHCAEGGRVVSAMDGRLDNRAALADLLKVSAFTASDAELAAQAYLRWGEAFSERLLGDFVVVIWDEARGALLCCRDVVGGRPLYYRESAGVLRCASSAMALFEGTDETPTPSFEAMALFLIERHVERPTTLLEGVNALMPGASLRATREAFYVSESVWPFPIQPVPKGNLRDHEELLRGTLRDAVRARLRARGRVAVHVSGGVDSSTIAAFATAELGNSMNSVVGRASRTTGSVDASAAHAPMLVRCVFPGLACDESTFSQAVADHLGLPIESVTMPGDLSNYAPTAERVLPGMLENPISHMLTDAIDAAHQKGARVTLTGAGSDQLFQRTGRELASAMRAGDVGRALSLSGILMQPTRSSGWARLLREGLKLAVPEASRSSVRAVLRQDGLPRWMSRRAQKVVRDALAVRRAEVSAFRGNAGVRAHSSGLFSRGNGAESARLSLATNTLVERFVWDVDYAHSIVSAEQIAAAKGHDLRHPFFDRRVIELALSLPDNERAAAPPEKAFLRRSVGAMLPPSVRDRTNAADFASFVVAALLAPHAKALAHLVRHGQLGALGLIDPNAASDVVLSAERHAEVLREVVTMATLELWLQKLAPKNHRGG